MTSHTADPAALSGYGPLSDPSGRQFTLRWVGQGIAEISEIAGGVKVKVADRAAAERLTNMKLYIARENLPEPDEDEYYLADLIGLTAVAEDGTSLGFVSVVHDYGAGVSLEIEREAASAMIVPFTNEFVPAVDVAAGRVTVAPPNVIDGMEDGFRRQGPPGHDAAEAERADYHTGTNNPGVEDATA